MIAEWGYFEFQPFIAGMISELALTTALCLFNFEILMFIMGAGFAWASCNQIGKYLGEWDIENAKRVLWIGTVFQNVYGVMLFGFLWMIWKYVAWFYHSNQEV